MNNKHIMLMLLSAEAAREKAKRIVARNSRYAEFMKFYSGGMMVFTGLLLAAIYGLLTHQIRN